MTRLYIPNILTISRILAVPVIVWCISEGKLDWAFWLFLIAGITDALDGWLARRFHNLTSLGANLDPLADKALLVGTYVTLVYFDLLPFWLLLLVITRDICIVGGAILFELTVGRWVVNPLMISKINTVSQIVLACLILGGPATGLDVRVFADIMIWVTAGTTVFSGLNYLHEWDLHERVIRAAENGEDTRS